MEARFKNQVAVVTGGAGDIGKAMARRLALEGAKVVIFDLNEEQLAATVTEFSDEGLDVSAICVDVTDEQSVKDGIARTLEIQGGLQVMINSAGIPGPTATNIVDYDTEAFEEIYRVNLKGSFLMTKHALPPMLEQDYGRILLIASISGKEGNPAMCGYSVTKAGVIGLVKAVGKEYAETGVTVNGLAPAIIHTSMTDNTEPESVQYMISKIPMKRTGKLEEVGAMATFIVSRECSFSTGAIFDLSGGRATY